MVAPSATAAASPLEWSEWGWELTTKRTGLFGIACLAAAMTARPRRKALKTNGWRLAEEVRGFGLLTRGEGFVADVMKRAQQPIVTSLGP